MDDVVGYYQRTADDYAAQIDPEPPPARAEALGALLARLPDGARVLEVGSGTGRDADHLERHGVTVRRTDVTPAFVERQRAAGHDAELLDLVHDDLGGPYDAVVAMCVLIHVPEPGTDAVLAKVVGALRPGGSFLVSVREEGDGGGDRGLTLWTHDAFDARLAAAGAPVAWRSRHVDEDDETWLTSLATR